MWQTANKLGFIENSGRQSLIPPPYKEVIVKSQVIYEKTCGNALESIYLRGSVCTGEVTKFSDFDMVGILNREVDDRTQKLMIESTDHLENNFPFINGIDLELVEKNKLLINREYINLRLNLISNSILIRGTDVSMKLPNLVPGPQLSRDIKLYVEDQYNDLFNYLKGTESRSYLSKVRDESFWCGWISRVIARSGIGLIMLNEPVYSNDVKLIAEHMVVSYPQFSELFNQTASWVVYPVRDRKRVRSFLEQHIPKYLTFWEKQLT